MDLFARDLVGSDWIDHSTATVEKGAFDVRWQNLFMIRHNGVEREVLRKDKIGFTSIDFKKRVVMVGSHTDYSGIDKEIIQSDGQLCIDTGISKMVAANMVPRNAALSISNSFAVTGMADSHVSFIYNMLVSWAKAVVYEANQQNGIEQPADQVRVMRRNYQDRHITVTKYEGEQALTDVYINLDKPNDKVLGPMHRYKTNVGRDDDINIRPDVVILPDGNEHDMHFYVTHLLGREEESAFNFEAPIEGIDSINRVSFIYPAYMGTLTLRKDQYDKSYYVQARLIWDLIIRYVSVNRVERQLGAAYQALSDCMYRALPDVAEGFAMREAWTNIYLPKPAYSRGKIPVSVQGDPYVSPSDSHLLTLTEYDKPIKYLILGGIMNYYASAGQYVAALHLRKSYPGLDYAYGYMCAKIPALTRPGTALSAARNIATGRIPPHMNYQQTGVVYDIRGYFRYEGQIHSVVEENLKSEEFVDYEFDGDRLITGTKHYPPVPLYGLYGLIRGDMRHVDHLRSNVEFTFKRTTRLTERELMVVANIYRLAEYNVKVEHAESGKIKQPWTSLDSPAINPMQVAGKWNRENIYYLEAISQRKNPRLQMPDPARGTIGQSISMTVSNLDIAITKPNRRHVLTYDNRYCVEEAEIPDIQIWGDVGIETVAITTLPAEEIVDVQDFRPVGREVVGGPHPPPEPVLPEMPDPSGSQEHSLDPDVGA